MSPDLTFVQGDTAPALHGSLHVPGDPNTPINLSLATAVRFQMRRADDVRYTVDAAAVIVNAQLGLVRYDWAANDLAQSGDFLAQFEVHFTDLTVQTNAVPATIRVRRQ